MNYTRDEIKAGLMVVISVGILIFFLVAVTGLDLFKETKEYKVLLKHTGGVVVGSLVRYGGLEVGKVTRVEIQEHDHHYVEIGIKVAAATPIKTDSKAFLSSIGLLGDYYIEISSGSIEAELLPPGSIIHSRETTQFSQLAQPVEELSVKLQELIDRLSDMMNDQSRLHVASMIATMDSMLSGNLQNINAIMENLRLTSFHFQKMSAHARELLVDDDVQFESTWKNVDETVVQLQKLTEELQKTAVNLNNVVSARDQNLSVILEQIEHTTRNLETFTRNIKDRPWNLIRKSEPEPRKMPK
jgi:phospholipid/cholesterol/gamma-HCH transport system substrate-binding protein